jgi:hypothetical protein
MLEKLEQCKTERHDLEIAKMDKIEDEQALSHEGIQHSLQLTPHLLKYENNSPPCTNSITI